jgi:hypothetical protein
MADIVMSVLLINKNNKPVETPKSKYLITYTAPVEEEVNKNYTVQILSLLIFLFAAYLSWSCNSNCLPSMSIIEKGFRSLIAGIFGTIYIIIYLISWSVGCRACVK